MRNSTLCFLLCALYACTPGLKHETKDHAPYRLIVLGNVQDGGSPHIGCNKACCESLFEKPDPQRKVVSLGLVDGIEQRTYMFEASPDFSIQTKLLNRDAGFKHQEEPHGVFLTHAHIGHYSGLMFLGMEAMNAEHTPVYVMPRMDTFLRQNGPWDQLVRHDNILLERINFNGTVSLSNDLKVTGFQVPHRDEYSETVGFKIKGPNKTALFIPDIDKWSKWDKNIIEEISKVDYAFIDGTFYDGNELESRDMSQIPHPFVIETMDLLTDLSPEDKAKVYFIHFNHTNPLLLLESEQTKDVLKAGFNIARLGTEVEL